MPSARTWWKGTKASLGARTDAAPAADIVTTTDGDAFVGDGTTLFAKLARLTKSSDPGAPVGLDTEINGVLYSDVTKDATGRVSDATALDGTRYLPRIQSDKITDSRGTTDVGATLEINGELYDYVEHDASGLASYGVKSDGTHVFFRLQAGRMACYWTGKKIVVVGTSITEGYNATSVGGIRQGFILKALRDDIGAVVDNQGVASSGICWNGTRALSLGATRAELTTATFDPNESYETRLLGKNADLYVFDHGYNDRTYTIGSITDTTAATFYGAYNKVIGALLTEKPAAQIMLITPPSLYTPVGGGLSAGTVAVRTAMLALADKYACPILDLSSRLQMNATQATAFASDTVHPDEEMHKRMARQLAAFVRGI